MTKPLLSICIPTYNRADFLRVMLRVLLPQVSEHSDQVEVWVLDNGSADDTQAVIRECVSLGPLRVIRNEKNIGQIRNIVKGPSELATGKYVWLLGDHNLMLPGAVAQVLKSLKSHENVDIFYVNFRCAAYPEHWPGRYPDGYSTDVGYLGNSDRQNSFISQWHELIRPQSALCTQMYAHIVNTQIWRDYWTGREIGPDFSDSLTTYPHTQMLIDTVFDKPSYYIGNPAIIIFNGAQSWGDPKTKCAVYLNGLPDLLKGFVRHGLSRQRLQGCKEHFVIPETTWIFIQFLRSVGMTALLAEIARQHGGPSHVWRCLASAIVESEYSTLSRCLKKCGQSLANRRNWWITNCRPVRWVRKVTSQNRVG